MRRLEYTYRRSRHSADNHSLVGSRRLVGLIALKEAFCTLDCRVCRYQNNLRILSSSSTAIPADPPRLSPLWTPTSLKPYPSSGARAIPLPVSPQFPLLPLVRPRPSTSMLLYLCYAPCLIHSASSSFITLESKLPSI